MLVCGPVYNHGTRDLCHHLNARLACIMNTILVALLAGAMAIFATISIEKLGGKLGGLLGSIPTTVVPASLGFLWESTDFVATTHALSVVPLGMLVNAMFLYVWKVLPTNLPNSWSLVKRLGAMSLISLTVWSVSAAGLIMLLDKLPKAHVFTAGLFGQILLITFGLWACRRHTPSPKGDNPVKPTVLISRGLLAGTAVGCSAWISGLGLPILAGMASVFPAIFLTTMVSVWLSQGEAVQSGAVGPMMLGSSSVGAYALLCIWTFPLGTFSGTLLAWVLAVSGTSIPAWWWLQRQAN